MLVIERQRLELGRVPSRWRAPRGARRISLLVPSCAVTSTRRPRQQARAAEDRGHAGRLEQRCDAAGHGAHDAGAALLHGGQIERDTAGLNAVRGEFGLRAIQQFG